MQYKKSPEADIENKKSMYFTVGLTLALALVLVAFEWKTFDAVVNELGKLKVELDEEEMIPITQQEPPPPPPPPPPQTTLIEIVEDDKDIDDEIDIKDSEADADTQIEFFEVKEEVVEEPEIFTIVEEMPGFPGGEEELFKYLAKSIKYPQMAKDAGISGIVYVTFVVKEDGSISDVRVLRGIGGGCDEVAVEVVKNMPKWKPGKQRGKPVRVQYNLPIRFTLR